MTEYSRWNLTLAIRAMASNFGRTPAISRTIGKSTDVFSLTSDYATSITHRSKALSALRREIPMDPSQTWVIHFGHPTATTLVLVVAWCSTFLETEKPCSERVQALVISPNNR